MFRPIRRKKHEISLPAAQQLLREARRGVLAVNGDDGYPYAIPINYLYDESRCAQGLRQGVLHRLRQ